MARLNLHRGPALALAITVAGCSRGTTTDAHGHTPAVDAPAVEDGARLVFRVEGRDIRTLTRAELEAAAPPETVTGFDPYYGRVKSFRALPLDRVLNAGLGGAVDGPMSLRHFVLRARDGYTVPIAGAQLLDGTAYLAERDLDVPGWEPIGPQRADPGPYYLVWKGADRGDLEGHPRPWQLAAVEIARFETVFPHTAPAGEAPDGPAGRGYAIFARECIRCHAINREGGHVGPDLNVPQSVVEYRPVEQIRAYIRNPGTFRYGNMPAHPALSDGDLDDLVGYFRAMSVRKHDPGAVDGGATR